MRKLIAAALVASSLTAPTAAPAFAFPVDATPKTALANDVVGGAVQNVAFRRFGGFHRGFEGFHRGFGGFHRGFVGRRFYGGRRFGYGGYGIGAGLAGLAAGAVIGGTVAAAARANDAVAYCERRFRSYDAATGTYLGYDGLRHRCP